MRKRADKSTRREDTLSRDRIIEEAVWLLDAHGEDGLTFRALSERLATGPGAIYWHIADKGDLVTAACDLMVSRTINDTVVTTPEATIHAIALGLFNLIDEHPWVGTAFTGAQTLSPVVRVLEIIGQQIVASGVPAGQIWAAVSTLVAYILGVSRQNAANRQLAHIQGLDRSDFLKSVSSTWSQLTPEQYPFARSVALQIRDHDDRADYLAGINLILRGIASRTRRSAQKRVAVKPERTR